MGHRGVDLADLKARRARQEAERDRQRLLEWAVAMVEWLGSPLEDGETDSRMISVPAGEMLVLSRSRAEQVS